MSKKNIIEINGKRYDAHTGEVLGASGSKPKKAVHHIDVIKPTGHSISPKQAKLMQAYHPSLTPHSASHPKAYDIQRHKASHPAHHPQPSSTLMRHTVHKPHKSLKRQTKATGPAESLAKQPQFELAVKASVKHLDVKRLEHAKKVPKSKQVRRFEHHQAPILVTVNRPALSPVQPAPSVARQAAARQTPKHKPRTTADLLEHALQHATSHQQPAPKRRRAHARRITSFSAMTLATISLLAVVAYQNLTTFQLQVASAKTGLPLSLPTNQPDGYRLSHLKYGQGYATLDFKSNSDDRAYTITQRASNWSSATLRDSYLAIAGKGYEAVDAAGRTVYIYNQQQDATWVSQGIWYKVAGNGSLSQKQLLELAASM